MTYLVTCFIAIYQIHKTRKKSRDNFKAIRIVFLFFLTTAILATFFQIINPHLLVSRIIVTSNLIIEIAYLFILQKNYIYNRRLKIAFTLLLTFCTFYTIKLSFSKWDVISYVPLYTLETLIAGTISLTFFVELNTRISIKNILNDPITLIMMGLFFCFGIPLSFYSSMTLIASTNPNFELETSIEFKQIIAYLSRFSTICYIVFNIFIIKAFKCIQTI